jgi:hypothetical protein
VTDDEEAPRPTERRSRFTSLFTPSAEAELSDPQLRERMRTLDTTERKVGFGDAGVVLLAALLIIPYLLHNTKQTTATTLPHRLCVAPSLKWTGKICQLTQVYHPSHFALPFILLLAIGVVLLFAVWRSMRALTIFMSLFAAIAGFRYSPIIFLCGMGVAIWLLVRSWRLQRFGAKDSKTVRKVANDRAAERKEARRAAKQSGNAPRATGKPAPTPSKRYTAPKAKPRRK